MAAAVVDRGLQLQLLGPVAARIGSVAVELGHPKQRSVLAMLALRPDTPVSTDELIEGLWPDGPPAAAVSTLQAYVSNLRRALEPDRSRRAPSSVIRTTTGGYQLTLDTEAIDAIRFERAVAGAARLDDPRAVSELLTEAIASWNGPALADFRYEQFALPHIARLEERLVDALELRVAADLELGRAAELVTELRRLTDDHPYRERLHGQLMVALYRAGRHAEALAAYDRLSASLRDELGLDPGPELRALQLAILDHDPSLLTRSSAPSRSGRTRRPAPGRAGRPKLVGRDDELRMLADAVAHAATGAGAVVIVEGEAGIGKTRLLEAVHDEAISGGALAAFARCVEIGGSPPYWPWIQLVRRLGVDEFVAAAGERAAALAPLLADTDEPAVHPGPPLHRIADGLIASLEELGRRGRAVLLVIDDLYSADPDSLALLNIVASAIDRIPVVVAGSHRGVDLGADHPLTTTLAHLSRLDGVVRLPLARLRHDDVRAIVRETVGGEIADEAIEAIHARAGGNAFFTVELSKLLDAAPDGATPESVPATVREVIQQRTRALSPGALSLLRTGAVIGREFEVGIALDIAGLSISDGADALDEIQRLGLLTDGDRPGTLRFAHVIVVDSLVQALGTLRRAQLHHRIARIVEERHGTDPGAWVEIAHHRCEAIAVGGVAEALDALERAGRYALDADALGLAESLVRRRLALVPAITPVADRDAAETEVLLDLVRVLTWAEGYHSPGVGEAVARLERLVGLDRGTATMPLDRPISWNDPVLSTMQARFSFEMVAGTIATAAPVVDAWLDIAEAQRDPMALLSANIARVVVAVHVCDLADAERGIAACRQALAALDPHGLHRVMLPLGQQSAAVTAFGFEAWAHFLGGRRARSDEVFAEARAICETLRHPFTTGYLVSVETMVAAMAGSPVRVHEVLAWGRRAMPDGLFWLFDEWHALIAAWADGMTGGDPGKAARAVRSGLEELRRRGARVVSTLYWAMASELELCAERPDAALDAARRGLEDATASGERFWTAELERLQAIALGRLRRHDESADALGRARRIAIELGARPLLDRLSDGHGADAPSIAGT